MICKSDGWKCWMMALVLAGVMTAAGALGAAAQEKKGLMIQKQKSIPDLEIRSIPSPPELKVEKRTPRRSTTPVEKKPLEPGKEAYEVRVDGVGMLYRIDGEANEAVIGDSPMVLDDNVTYIMGEDQYAAPPASMIGKKVAYRVHTVTGLVTEIRMYEDVRHLVEKNE